ncbi:MAG: hypothetical protein QXH91_07740 [Candidatus Bathyarchaeia archaeon]
MKGSRIGRNGQTDPQRKFEEELGKEIGRIFERKKREIGIEATLKLGFLEDFPIIGEYVYGQAFPNEKIVVIEVYALYATKKEITRTICEELLHIKHPEMKHGPEFWKMVEEAVKHPIRVKKASC